MFRFAWKFIFKINFGSFISYFDREKINIDEIKLNGIRFSLIIPLKLQYRRFSSVFFKKFPTTPNLFHSFHCQLYIFYPIFNFKLLFLSSIIYPIFFWPVLHYFVFNLSRPLLNRRIADCNMKLTSLFLVFLTFICLEMYQQIFRI